MTPAVFLDRDGVLNEADPSTGASPRTVDGFRLLDAAAPAAERLYICGYTLVVVTNQPDIGRGLMSSDQLDAMHRMLLETLPIASVKVCPHAGSEGCTCRKPAPGMLTDAAKDLHLDLGRSWMVGDRWVDVMAGAAAGVRTILISRPYSWSATTSGSPPADLAPTHTALDLEMAAEIILEQDAA